MARILNFLFISLIFFGCSQSKKSELADVPCVILIPESKYIIIGQNYNAEIILNCDRPDSANQISAYANFEAPKGSRGFVMEEKNDAEFYFDKGRIFCRYYVVTLGKNTLKGKLMIKTQRGDTITHTFEDTFYVAPPDIVISSSKFNYLLSGENNAIKIGAPGFPSEDLIVTATNADLKRNPNSMNIYYLIKPNNKNDVEVSTSVKVKGDTINLGTWKMKVIDKLPQ